MIDKLLLFPGRSDRGVFTHVIDSERAYLEKTASEYHPTIGAYINDAKPMPGKTQILLTALGALEAWGPNVNGDGFPEAALAHEGTNYGHKTFLTHAKVYKHHCFREGALVTTREGLRRIEDVEVGEDVLTHEGRYKPVVDRFERKYSGTFVNIRANGLDDVVQCTGNHPFQVVKREGLLCPHHRKNGKNFCTFFKNKDEDCCRKCGRKRALPEVEWAPAEDIRPGDYLVSTKRLLKSPQNVADAEALGRLAGFFLAEGCYAKKYGKRIGAQFTFSKEEEHLHEALRSAGEVLGLNITGPYIHPVNNTGLLAFCNQPMAENLLRWCGEYSGGKRLSSELVDILGREGSLALVGAYIDGDGHVYKKDSKNYGQVRVRSCNRALLHDIRGLCAALGIPSTITWDNPRGQSNSLIKNTSPNGCLAFRPRDLESLKKYCSCIEDVDTACSTKTSTRSFDVGDKFFTYVQSVELLEDDSVVYNLEVQDDHSYQVYGFNTHNCNKDPNNNYGDVALSVYNPTYRRVELIVAVDNVRGRDIVDKIEAGQDVPWSMGARVPWDECSICGNRAPTRAQYCEHARYNLGRIDADTGKLVYVINRYPKFHDISQVLIGADRIAKTLQKVASPAQVFMGVSSALLAEKMAERKRAAIEKEIPADESNPPASSKTLEALVRGIPEVKAQERVLPRETLDHLGRFPLERSMSTLASLGILPKPQEFQRIFLIRMKQRPLADELDRRNMCFSPEMVPSPEEKHMRALPMSPDFFEPRIMDAMKPFMAERSYARPHLSKRVVLLVKTAENNEQDLPYFIKTAADVAAAGLDDERKPVSILPMLMAAAGVYAAFSKKSPDVAAKGVDKLITKHPGLAAALGVGLASTFGAMMGPSKTGKRSHGDYVNPDVSSASRFMSQNKSISKHAAGNFPKSKAMMKRLFIGVPAAYMASGILQKHKELNPYQQEGKAKGFLRRNPDLVSGALIADAMLASQGRGTYGALKKMTSHTKKLTPHLRKAISSIGENVGVGGFGKAAGVGDVFGETAKGMLIPLAMGGGNVPGRVAAGLADQAILGGVSKWLENRSDRKKQTSPQLAKAANVNISDY